MFINVIIVYPEYQGFNPSTPSVFYPRICLCASNVTVYTDFPKKWVLFLEKKLAGPSAAMEGLFSSLRST